MAKKPDQYDILVDQSKKLKSEISDLENQKRALEAQLVARYTSLWETERLLRKEDLREYVAELPSELKEDLLGAELVSATNSGFPGERYCVPYKNESTLVRRNLVVRSSYRNKPYLTDKGILCRELLLESQQT